MVDVLRLSRIGAAVLGFIIVFAITPRVALRRDLPSALDLLLLFRCVLTNNTSSSPLRLCLRVLLHYTGAY